MRPCCDAPVSRCARAEIGGSGEAFRAPVLTLGVGATSQG